MLIIPLCRSKFPNTVIFLLPEGFPCNIFLQSMSDNDEFSQVLHVWKCPLFWPFFFPLEIKICFGRFFSFSWTMSQRVKASACNAGNPGSIPGSGRFPGEGNGNPLQYSCLENSMDGGTLCIHGVTKSWTRLSDFSYFLSVVTYYPNYLLTWIVFVKKPGYSFLHHSCGSSSCSYL